MGISHNGILVGIEGNLPHPVADVGRLVHNSGGILAGIRVRLADIEHPAADHAQLRAVEVAQDGAVAVIDINHVEVEPVGHLVVRMTGRVGDINLILAVALIFGVRTRAGGLHDLLRAEIERAVVVGVGHRETRDGGMPIDAAPAEVDVFGIVTQDKGRRIGRVVGRSQILLVTQLADVTGLFRYTVPNLGLVCVARVEDHHTLVGQDDEGGVVVVVGLETRAHENVRLALL